ncbi:type IV secretion system DNA-binding domain-containing protein [Candidatus Wolfebacteria bacterium]|nr:type IV secretion system DNA-binding domain-containing protein [Candidatus Wolfebacteria bacterium]
MSDITLFGKTNFRGKQVRFGIKLDDRRRHFYIIGKTGMGKTVLLENMVIADILAGRGVAVVDPHGEFAENLLNFIPEHRIDDVIYFNPVDIDYPIAFNALERVDIEHRHLIASGLMGVFKKIWPDVWSARMEYILNNALLALLEYPGSTLLGIMRMLAEKDYRKKIVDNLQDPVIKAFWINEFDRYTQRLEIEAVAAIQNKVGQFVSNPLIRNIVGQTHSAIDMRKVMDEGKILIINIAKGRIGEDNSALLGAMMVTKLQLAAMSRVDIPMEERRDFYLYVDEFQNFSTDSFANILSEARKYRLNLILAHQYIEQLSETVRPAIFGNVGTIVCFRIGAEDAEFLEKEFAPEFTANDLLNLAKYHIYVKLMIDGVASKPCSATTLEPQTAPSQAARDVIIENCRGKYGTPRKMVEEKIAAEWVANGEAIEDRVKRREEMPLHSVLLERPQTPRREEDRREKEKEKKAVNIEDLRQAIEESLKDLGNNAHP